MNCNEELAKKETALTSLQKEIMHIKTSIFKESYDIDIGDIINYKGKKYKVHLITGVDSVVVTQIYKNGNEAKRPKYLWLDPEEDF